MLKRDLHQEYYDAVFHGAPCKWEGCKTLRDRRVKELAALAEPCSKCDRGAVDMKYQTLVATAVQRIEHSRFND